jgi:hypothetical protein
MYALRRGLGLEEYLTDKVFNNMGLLFVTFALIWGYFTFAEHLTVWYGNEPSEMAVFSERISGDYAKIFWTMIVLNIVIPLGVLAFPSGRRPLATAVVGLHGRHVSGDLGRVGNTRRLLRLVRVALLPVRAVRADRLDLGSTGR